MFWYTRIDQIRRNIMLRREDLEIIDPNLPPQLEGLKDTYLDVKARLNNGTLVIIEMQVLNVQSFGKRVLFNAAKTYAFQLQRGQGYRYLKPVIALTLTDSLTAIDRIHYQDFIGYNTSQTNSPSTSSQKWRHPIR